jgi:hypothetical protein
MRNDLIENMLEVTLNDAQDFLKVRETLSRIGIASESSKKLYQSCHILHKRGRYYVVHFKELFALDGKPVNFDEADIARRNKIANLLEEWELIRILDKEMASHPMASMGKIKIVPYKEKDDWELVAKYNIGKRRGYSVDDE